jgi:hypothetical protein
MARRELRRQGTGRPVSVNRGTNTRLGAFASGTGVSFVLVGAGLIVARTPVAGPFVAPAVVIALVGVASAVTSLRRVGRRDLIYAGAAGVLAGCLACGAVMALLCYLFVTVMSFTPAG